MSGTPSDISSGTSGKPELLVIGHVACDLAPGGEGWRLGGCVTFAAVTAARLGAGAIWVATSGPAGVVEALRAALPDPCCVAAVPAATATTFENAYVGSARRQVLRNRAAPLTLADIPEKWRGASLVLLAPVAGEVDPALAAAFPGALVAATPQGWLRRWTTDGAVYPGPFDAADQILPHLDALILSREDLLPPPGSDLPGLSPDEADARIAAWARMVPLVVVTRGAAGALLYRDGHGPEVFPGYTVHEADPTGAGDVFATALLLWLHRTGDPRAAVDFGNRVAALSVEGPGIEGIPSRADMLARYPDLAGTL